MEKIRQKNNTTENKRLAFLIINIFYFLYDKYGSIAFAIYTRLESVLGAYSK
ncbi:MAG: hypothetical protein AAB332_01090 [Planctomycetota bacterium]